MSGFVILFFCYLFSDEIADWIVEILRRAKKDED